MAKLTAKEQANARGFMLDLFYCNPVFNIQKTPEREERYSYYSYLRYGSAIKAATVICNEIKFRTFDFSTVDAALQTLEGYKFYGDPTFNNQSSGRPIKRPANMLADYIAEFCKKAGVVWDDVGAAKTPFEMDHYKQTLLGAALWERGLFASQVSAAKTTPTATPATSVQRAPSTRVAGQPKNNYKSSGPQSANVRDLKGNPGQKSSASGNLIFKIIGDNSTAAKVEASVHIKPLSKQGVSGNTNKVFIGSANGYTDCICFFDDLNKANAFLASCQKVCPSTVTNLHVVKKAADSNGYFTVGTEFGDVLVAARKLNEAVALEESQQEKEVKNTSYKIKDINVYEEAFFKYE